MQKWSNFMKESIKYSRILWNLKQILQYSQKHSPKGHMVKLFSDVTKNLFYDKSCVFSKNSTCILVSIHGNPRKWVKNGF